METPTFFCLRALNLKNNHFILFKISDCVTFAFNQAEFQEPNKMKKLVFILLGLLFFTYTFSQEAIVLRDVGFWGGASIEKTIKKDYEFKLDQQLRFNKNASSFDDYIAELEANYKVNKHFKLGTHLRYIHNKTRKGATEDNLRYGFDIQYKTDLLNDFKFYYRLRFQKGEKDFQNSRIYEYSSAFRHLVKLKYTQPKKMTPYISYELFRVNRRFEDPSFNKWRTFLGSEFKSFIGEIDLSLGYEREIQTQFPFSFFFTKFIYTFKL